MIYYELCEELTGQHFVQNIFKLKAKSVGKSFSKITNF